MLPPRDHPYVWKPRGTAGGHRPSHGVCVRRRAGLGPARGASAGLGASPVGAFPSTPRLHCPELRNDTVICTNLDKKRTPRPPVSSPSIKTRRAVDEDARRAAGALGTALPRPRTPSGASDTWWPQPRPRVAHLRPEDSGGPGLQP